MDQALYSICVVTRAKTFEGVGAKLTVHDCILFVLPPPPTMHCMLYPLWVPIQILSHPLKICALKPANNMWAVTGIYSQKENLVFCTNMLCVSHSKLQYF